MLKGFKARVKRAERRLAAEGELPGAVSRVHELQAGDGMHRLMAVEDVRRFLGADAPERGRA
jgi:hypothetical protein